MKFLGALISVSLAAAPALAQKDSKSAADKKLAASALACDAAAVTAQLEQRAGPARSGVEEAFSAAMDAKPGEAKTKDCLAVLKALLARGASADRTRGEGSLMEEARAAERTDISDVLSAGGAMGCEKAAGKVDDTVDEQGRSFAIKVVLPRCGDDGAEALTRLLVHPEDDLKREAVFGLARVGPKAAAAIPQLTQLMKSGESELALSAAEALARIEKPVSPAVEAHFVKRLNSKNDEQVNRALLGLSSGGLGATANVSTLLKFALQTSDPARSGAALEILVQHGDAFAKAAAPFEKTCKGLTLDCRTEPCQIAGDFDGNGKLDVARLFAQPGKGEPGVAFQLDNKTCVKWETGAAAFTSWRLELAPDGKSTAVAISGGKAGDGLLSVRSGQAIMQVGQ
jgi:HEAT repeats